MFNAPCHSRTRSIAVMLSGALIGVTGSAWAQAPVWSQHVYGSYPANANSNFGWQTGLPPTTAIPQRREATMANVAPRGRLARLVRNPNTMNGLPPFALADQTGTIQRLVEPVPGIDLEPYVGEVVNVRHDTGPTLLATQLELPPRRLRPMVGADPIAYDAFQGSPTAPAGAVLPTRFVDDDDGTTELIDQDETSPEDAGAPIPSNSGPTNPPAGNPESLMFYDGIIPIEVGPTVGGPAYAAPMYPGPVMAAPLAGNAYPPGAVVIDGMGGPCPQCGGYHQAPGLESAYVAPYGYGSVPGQPAKRSFHFFGDVEANFLRVHVLEVAVGKLSEKYEFSPRFIVGVDGPGNFDARARYWTYDRATQVLSGGSVRFEFDVLDLEAIHRFDTPAADVVLAAGARIAHIELSDVFGGGTTEANDLIGLTIAADADVPLYVFRVGQLAGVCGGRLSILGGDWTDFRDDNVVAHEIYGGFQFVTAYRGIDLHARAAFEIQNWRSDLLTAIDLGSIGFIGPGLQIGAAY